MNLIKTSRSGYSTRTAKGKLPEAPQEIKVAHCGGFVAFAVAKPSSEIQKFVADQRISDRPKGHRRTPVA
jgi:hypothetical protein